MNPKQLMKNYGFSQKDIENIKELASIMEKYEKEFLKEFYDFIFNLPNVKDYLYSEEIVLKHKNEVQKWFRLLFEGKYDKNYFNFLKEIGKEHVNIGWPNHYVNISFSFIREFIIDKINQEIDNPKKRKEMINSINKLLDINLDTITESYIDAEIEKHSTKSKIEKTLINISKKVADLLDLILVIALIIVAFFVLELFVTDIYDLLIGEVKFEEGIIRVLGSLLILWAVSELMTEELKHLRGGGFALGAFIGVALAAMIRKILIAALSTGKYIDLLAYGLIVLFLGITYWLIAKKSK